MPGQAPAVHVEHVQLALHVRRQMGAEGLHHLVFGKVGTFHGDAGHIAFLTEQGHVLVVVEGIVQGRFQRRVQGGRHGVDMAVGLDQGIAHSRLRGKGLRQADSRGAARPAAGARSHFGASVPKKKGPACGRGPGKRRAPFREPLRYPVYLPSTMALILRAMGCTSSRMLLSMISSAAPPVGMPLRFWLELRVSLTTRPLRGARR